MRLFCFDSLFYVIIFIFFFNDTATTEIYTYLHTLSLHDALPIYLIPIVVRDRRLEMNQAAYIQVGDIEGVDRALAIGRDMRAVHRDLRLEQDRKSTRLNSSH